MDNAAFDRLARLLGSGASRRHTLRALITAALVGGTADELLAKDKKNRAKNRKQGNDRDGNNDKDKDKNKDRRNGRGGQANAEAKKKNQNKNKQKRKKKKKKNSNGGNSGGNSCAGTPLQPGQDFVDCDFSDANLRGENLKGSLFKNVDLTDADLCGADLESSSFADTTLVDANLTDVNLDSSSHSKGDFSGANLTNATFRVATFSKVDFSGADLTGADFTGATLDDTDFAGAVFCRTIHPNGNVDNRDCDICDNECGLCEDCDDEDCTPPDCCPNPEGPGGICVNTDTDPLNCGGCDAACFTNLSNACVDGECVCGNEPECSGGETCCRGEGGGATRCIDTDTDPLHCGACDEACLIPLNPCLSVECQGGQCVEVGAADGTPCELEGDPGVCCAAGSSVTCVVGTECCSNAQCDSGEACCEGQCIDVEDDPNNCGGCDVICLTPTNPCLTNECIEGGCVDGTLSDGTECAFVDDTGVCCASGGTSTCVFGAECCTDAQCGTGQSCCGGQCLNTQTDFDRCGSCTNQCPATKADACVGGDCVCGEEPECNGNQTCCPGEGGNPASCLNLNNDTLNCGACGFACLIPTNPCLAVECQEGGCVEVPVLNGSACAVGEVGGICCASGETSACIVGAECCDSSVCEATEACCENQCIDVQDNFDNCGECGNSCTDSVNQCFHRDCVQGECQTLPDEDGEPCFAGEEGICCASTPTTSICIGGGQCCTDLECPEGDSCCDNTCFETSSDFDHCGGCDGCDPDLADTCVEGTCVCGTTGAACGAGETCCNGQCVDTDTDTDNCGTCGNACDPPLNSCNTVLCLEGTCNNFADPDGTICVEGQDEGVCCFDDNAAVCLAGAQCCSDSGCDVTEACCDNQCVNPNTDFDHCGICTNACIEGKADACFNGQCVCGSEFQCSETETCCNGQCVDTSNDLENCGSCGETCGANETCVESGCVCPGIPCEGQCLAEGPDVCCLLADCETRLCYLLLGCNGNVCEYQQLADNTDCGFGGTCEGGVCIGQSE